ncbi:MAG: hypoxanthine phosphoribosyltransferase [Bacteroidales bacterium]|nr:hypoxanthine phosphoribosyltransferase [Bacteroidales bacterium]
MKTVQVLDKSFSIYLSEEKILEQVKRVADEINRDLEGQDPIFMGILNGSFMFASDLYKDIVVDSQITFLKLASYEGTSSTGKIKRLIGINEDIKDKTVVVIEDIVDTGHTLENIIKQLNGYEPKSIKIVTLLFKPGAYQKDYPIDYTCFEIPNDFILGYGLDYDGYGRNLRDIYKIVE